MTLSTIGGVLLLCLVLGIVAVIADSDDTDDPQTLADRAGAQEAPAAEIDEESMAPDEPEETREPEETDEPQAPVEEPDSIPTTGRDGQFEFTVTEVETGVAEVNQMPDNQFWEGRTAQGEFVLVTVQVENIGKSARTFSDFNQHAYDTDGRRFDADTQAGWEANGGADVWLTDINPGNVITGILVFDVPPDTELVKLRLHDSMFSRGVEVGLP